MKILVTGQNGQVARSLAERAVGHELVFAARPELDLAVPSSVERAIDSAKPDLIVSAAAYTAVDKAEDEPELAMMLNGDGPGVIGRAAARIGAPVIHLSTDYVFDGHLDRPWREEDAVSPLGVYGASKLSGEHTLAASGADYTILRTAWVYSPFGSNFVRTMLRAAENRDTLTVVDDQFGCPTSALDIADAVMIVASAWAKESSRRINSVYHFAGSGETHWAGFARAIMAESIKRHGPTAEVRNVPSSSYPAKARRPINSRLDCTRFIQDFDHRPPHWQESLGIVMNRLLPAGAP